MRRGPPWRPQPRSPGAASETALRAASRFSRYALSVAYTNEAVASKNAARAAGARCFLPRATTIRHYSSSGKQGRTKKGGLDWFTLWNVAGLSFGGLLIRLLIRPTVTKPWEGTRRNNLAAPQKESWRWRRTYKLSSCSTATVNQTLYGVWPPNVQLLIPLWFEKNKAQNIFIIVSSSRNTTTIATKTTTIIIISGGYA